MRPRDNNQVTGVYELKLKHRIDIDSPGPRVLAVDLAGSVFEHTLNNSHIVL